LLHSWIFHSTHSYGGIHIVPGEVKGERGLTHPLCKNLSYQQATVLLPISNCFTSALEPTSHVTQKIPDPNYSSPSQRPPSEHASLTCYTLLSHSITFLLFHSELNTYVPFQKIISSICSTGLFLSNGRRTYLVALYLLPHLFAHQLLSFSFISF